MDLLAGIRRARLISMGTRTIGVRLFIGAFKRWEIEPWKPASRLVATFSTFLKPRNRSLRRPRPVLFPIVLVVRSPCRFRRTRIIRTATIPRVKTPMARRAAPGVKTERAPRKGKERGRG